MDQQTESSTSVPPPPFDLNECMAALRGEAVPRDLNSYTAQCCTVRGIRLYLAFAESPAIKRLCDPAAAADLYRPLFARARHARLIMSGTIPDLRDPQTHPYCIWHPEFATETTYRQLAKQYPAMRYQVGRACAAAGYDTLYGELDLLPDVTIAEEARESRNEGSKAIYEAVMAAPIRYKVMDDYHRGVDLAHPKHPAFLDAQTWVWRDL